MKSFSGRASHYKPISGQVDHCIIHSNPKFSKHATFFRIQKSKSTIHQNTCNTAINPPSTARFFCICCLFPAIRAHLLQSPPPAMPFSPSHRSPYFTDPRVRKLAITIWCLRKQERKVDGLDSGCVGSAMSSTVL